MQPITLQDGTQLDPKVVKVMRAIRQVESGGDYNAIGDNGDSKGAYQFNKGNWKSWAGQYLGDSNALMTPENQNKLMYQRISEQKDKGLQPDEIAALHNGAHKDPATGDYAYNNPEYGQRFRQVLTGQSQTDGYVTQGQLPPATGTPEVPQDKGFLGDVSSDVSSRLGQAGSALSQSATGQINPLSGILQTAGAVGGALTDVTGDVLKRIPVVNSIIDALGKGVGSLAQTSMGQSLIKEYGQFAQAHPELSADIGAVGNIVGGVGAFEGAGALKDLAKAGIGKALGRDVISQVAEDLAPEVRAGTKAATSLTKKGLIKSTLTGEIGTPIDAGTKEIASSVSDAIPNYKNLPTYTDKVNALNGAVENEANNLINGVKGQGGTWSNSNLIGAVKDTKIPIGVRGVSDSQVSGILDYVSQLGQNSTKDAEGALNLAKTFRQTINSEFGENIWSKDTPIARYIRNVNESLNNFASKTLPDGRLADGTKFSDSLSKQKNLYRAIDRLAPKASQEIGTTRLGRLAGRHPILTGLVKKAGLGATIGLGGSGAIGLYRGLTGQ